jgi:hypothetical protein
VVFARRLRDDVRNGAITTSIRIWQSPKVKVGGRYPVEGGHVEVEAIHRIELSDITHDMAVKSGFLGVVDLLKVARHGPGQNVYFIEFHFAPTACKAEL